MDDLDRYDIACLKKHARRWRRADSRSRQGQLEEDGYLRSELRFVREFANGTQEYVLHYTLTDRGRAALAEVAAVMAGPGGSR